MGSPITIGLGWTESRAGFPEVMRVGTRFSLSGQSMPMAGMQFLRALERVCVGVVSKLSQPEGKTRMERKWSIHDEPFWVRGTGGRGS